MTEYTPAVRLVLPPFDQNPWDEDVNTNFRIIDSFLGTLYALTPAFLGEWVVATAYVVGNQVLDATDGSMWECAVAHTSIADPGTFSDDRTANPTYWTVLVVAPGGVIGAETTARIAADAANASASIHATQGYLSGMTLGAATATSVSVGAGACVDSSKTYVLTLNSTMIKLTSATWAAGTGNGGMGTGLVATLDTWYHVFALMVAGPAFDVYFDTSVSAANAPVGTIAVRRIGSFKLDGSVNVTPFDQYGDRFDLRSPVSEYSGTPGVTGAQLLTLTGVPTGLAMEAILSGAVSDATTPNSALYLSATVQTDLVPGTTGVTAVTGPIVSSAHVFNTRVMTDTIAQIRRRVSSITQVVSVNTNGWVDLRGRG